MVSIWHQLQKNLSVTNQWSVSILDGQINVYRRRNQEVEHPILTWSTVECRGEHDSIVTALLFAEATNPSLIKHLLSLLLSSASITTGVSEYQFCWKRQISWWYLISDVDRYNDVLDQWLHDDISKCLFNLLIVSYAQKPFILYLLESSQIGIYALRFLQSCIHLKSCRVDAI